MQKKRKRRNSGSKVNKRSKNEFPTTIGSIPIRFPKECKLSGKEVEVLEFISNSEFVYELAVRGRDEYRKEAKEAIKYILRKPIFTSTTCLSRIEGNFGVMTDDIKNIISLHEHDKSLFGLHCKRIKDGFYWPSVTQLPQEFIDQLEIWLLNWNYRQLIIEKKDEIKKNNLTYIYPVDISPTAKEVAFNSCDDALNCHNLICDRLIDITGDSDTLPDLKDYINNLVAMFREGSNQFLYYLSIECLKVYSDFLNCLLFGYRYDLILSIAFLSDDSFLDVAISHRVPIRYIIIAMCKPKLHNYVTYWWTFDDLDVIMEYRSKFTRFWGPLERILRIKVPIDVAKYILSFIQTPNLFYCKKKSK